MKLPAVMPVSSTLALSLGVNPISVSITFSGTVLVSVFFVICLVISNGLVGAVIILANPATLLPFATHTSIAFIAAVYGMSIHKLAVAPAVSDQSANFVEALVNHHILAHLLAIQVAHCIIVNTSDATPTGSFSIVFIRLSKEPYLSISDCLPSFVATNLANHAIVSTGLVIHLSVAVAVLTALHGILAYISTALNHSSPAPVIAFQNVVS